MTSTTETQVKAVLAKYLAREADSIRLDHKLGDDLGLDSMATIEILYDVEDAFDLQIPDEDLNGMETVGDVVKFTAANIASEDSAASDQ